MRAFIAIDLPEPIKAVISEQQQALRRALSTRQQRDQNTKWTRPDGIHLTLKFLGEISEKQVAQIVDSLAAIGSFEPFALRVKGFGFFPNAHRPRVLWVGLEASESGPGVPAVAAGDDQDGHATPALAQLADRVEQACESCSFAPETRAFSPHLTLARFKVPTPQPELLALLEPQRELTLGQFEVSEFFLFESKLSPQGAQYRKVARFPR